MEELEEAGWESNAERNEDISYKDMKVQFELADNERRDSVELISAQRRTVRKSMSQAFLSTLIILRHLTS